MNNNNKLIIPLVAAALAIAAIFLLFHRNAPPAPSAPAPTENTISIRSTARATPPEVAKQSASPSPATELEREITQKTTSKAPPPLPALPRAKKESTDKTGNALSVKRFVAEFEKSVDSMSPKTLERAVDNILNTNILNPAELAVAMAKSKNAKCAEIGLDLMTRICVERPELLEPNKFLVEFARRGMKSMPRISRIMDETDDDFAREWACELFVEIYFHNTKGSNSRHKELAEIKRKERKIYDFARDIASDPARLSKIAKSGDRPGDTIRKQWGDARRYPLKMLAIIQAFDMLSPKTVEAVSARVIRIIDSYDLRYDILGRVNGKTLDRPRIPLAARLRLLASAVFKNKYKDTSAWIPKNEGGFTVDELEYAVESRDLPEMRRMNRILRKIIGDVLRAKLAIGLGNLEIRLLRHFDQTTWKKRQFHWRDKALTLLNDSHGIMRISLTRLSDTSGRELNERVEFTLPAGEKLVWFLPEGLYSVESSGSGSIDIKKKRISLLTNDFTIVLRKSL